MSTTKDTAPNHAHHLLKVGELQMGTLAAAFQDALYGAGNDADRDGKIYRRPERVTKVRTTRTTEARRGR